MIVPDLSSPLRPVIAAFYEAACLVQPDWGADKIAQTLRQILVANGNHAVASSVAGIDLAIGEQIGVVVVASTQQITEATRRAVRQALAADGAPKVALIVAFAPIPRLARVDAPRQAQAVRQQTAAPASAAPPLEL